MSDQQGAAPAEQGPVIYKGLAGVPVDYTAISKVNPDTNSLLYRGYPVQELAASVHLRGGRLPALVRRAPRRHPAGRVRGARALAPRARPRGEAHHRRAAAHRPPDGRRAHRRQRHRRERSADPRRLPRGEPRQGDPPVREAAVDRHVRPAPPPRARVRRAARRPRLLGELPLAGVRRGARARGRERVRRVDDPLRRALVQRVHLHRARDHVDALRPVLGGRRRDRRAQGRAARRRERGRHARLRGDRHRRMPSGGLARRRARRQAQDHGLRPPRLQARRLARAHDARRPRAHGRALRPPRPARALHRARDGHGRAQGHQAEPRLPDRSGLPPDGLRHRRPSRRCSSRAASPAGRRTSWSRLRRTRSSGRCRSTTVPTNGTSRSRAEPWRTSSSR